MRHIDRLLDHYERGHDFTVLDTEYLQGPGTTNNWVVEIGGVRAGLAPDPWKPEFHEYLYFNAEDHGGWRQYWSSMNISGWQPADLLQGRPRLEVVREFVEWIKGTILITHSPADLRTLKYEFDRHDEFRDMPDPWSAWIDSGKLVRETTSLKKWNLKAVCKHFDIEYPDTHRALDDARATRSLVRRILTDQRSGMLWK